VLVLLDVKSRVVVPTERYCVLETHEAVHYCALVGASAHSGITEGHEAGVVRFEASPCFLRALFENDDHETAHEEGSICSFCVVERRVVVNFVGSVLLVVH